MVNMFKRIGMTIREKFEEREASFIIGSGCLSSASKGRRKDEDHCNIRTVFQVDKDRIVYSNAFRRLKYKTQVYLSPLGDHYRTRLTHTLEVAQIARNIARAMRLNEDLVEAIALGHDLGHTPFGHSGEVALKEIYKPNFSHSQQSLRVVDKLERHGDGLNLTLEVRDGILKHSKGLGAIIPEHHKEKAITLEGQIVRVADIMAYINHDLDDAIRSGVIKENQVPKDCVRIIGSKHSERAAKMVWDLVSNSDVTSEKPSLNLSKGMYKAMNDLRGFLFENVYRSDQVHREFEKSKRMLIELFKYCLLKENNNSFEDELAEIEIKDCTKASDTKERMVADFIASLTDRYAMELYSKIFFPSPFK